MDSQNPYETLDPEDWDKMRSLAHQTIDDSFDYLKTVSDRPVWQAIPDEKRPFFDTSVPLKPQDPSSIYNQYKEFIEPYPMGNIHPRFWGWYMGNGTILGAIADFLASVMNSNLVGGSHSAVLVEAQVIKWIKEIVGFSEKSSGILVSGASMANFIGLTVARNSHSGNNIRQEGLQNNNTKLTVYASTETHSSNQKAIENLGIGSNYYRKIPVNHDYSININELKRSIIMDRENGFKPICIIGNAGTINTGAIDDLEALAELSRKEDIWFHVDGAIGAVAVISDKVKPLLSGIEKADSLALDLHKWLHVPFEAGCILIRDSHKHINTFTLTPDYLSHETRGLPGGNIWYSDYGLQLSRSFRALKVWMTFKEHGIERLARMIDRNIDQARYFCELLSKDKDMEIVAPPGLDIVCFRYNPGNLPEEKLNSINNEILLQLHERGIAVPSYTRLDGKYCIRIAIANHRSRYDDFELLADAVKKIGKEITGNKF